MCSPTNKNSKPGVKYKSQTQFLSGKNLLFNFLGQRSEGMTSEAKTKWETIYLELINY